jgi:hypothetical protein
MSHRTKKRRMHNVMPNSRAYIYHLERFARRIGVHIVTEACARRLIVENGAVSGVEYEGRDGAAKAVRAGKGVVLAAGDYAANPDMKREFISDAVARTEAVNPTATGDGHRMALELGARIINRDLFGGGARFVRPPKPSWISKLPPSRWLMRPAGWALKHAPAPLVRYFIMSFMTTIMVPSRELYEAGAILVTGMASASPTKRSRSSSISRSAGRRCVHRVRWRDRRAVSSGRITSRPRRALRTRISRITREHARISCTRRARWKRWRR